jgi:Flp pilus assembly protein TadD
MTTRVALTFGLSALLFGGTMVGCTHGDHLASASSRNAEKLHGQAADLAAKAGKAIANHKGDKAVEYAEAAVALQPKDVGYRVLLGQSYFQAGRFASAHQAFADVLTLDPNNASAALNLALAETAEGDWVSARATLNDHAATIPAADRGLALALAGDPKGGVAVLLPAAQQQGADAKTRQNLALAFALAGDWRDARVVVSMDLSPAKVDERLGQWAQFVSPHHPADQVAALLGVTPSRDPGQPVALALNAASVPVVLADNQPSPAPAADTSSPAVVEPAPTAPAVPAKQVAQVVFGPRHEVVQQLPASPTPAVAPRLARGKAPIVEHAGSAATPSFASGTYYVQLGAYDNAGVAHDGWVRATRRLPALAGQIPQGMSFTQNGASFYRLSVGGFSKDDARRLCGQYHARGGRCFIRTGAGDQVAQWAHKGTEFASR